MILMDIRDVLRDILGSHRVQCLFLKNNCARQEASSMDFGFREQLYKDFDYVSYVAEIMSLVPEENVIDYRDDFGLHYLVFEGRDADAGTYAFFGPYLYHSRNETDYRALLVEHSLSEEGMKAIRWYFKRIPLIKDARSWRQLFSSLLARYLANPDVEIHSVRADRLEKVREKPGISLSSIPYASIEARYEVENAMLAAVRQGNISEAIYQQNRFMGFTLDQHHPDALRDARDMVIAVSALLRKAAEQAAVHPMYIDALSGQYIAEIEEAEDPQQAGMLVPRMIRGYCRLVKEYSREQYSGTVRSCLNYIEFNYARQLSLSNLATHFSVNKNYLSARFHRETGVTVTEYINATRVSRSLPLLSKTTDALQTIAEQCGFSDANYFTRTFKKIHGMTPNDYRRSLARRKP